MKFDKIVHGQQTKCLVKTSHGYVMKFNTVLQVLYQDNPPLHIAKGEYFEICDSRNTNADWTTDMYSSMDYINVNDSQNGWCFINNIEEPICLIHNCLSFTQVKH